MRITSSALATIIFATLMGAAQADAQRYYARERVGTKAASAQTAPVARNLTCAALKQNIWNSSQKLVVVKHTAGMANAVAAATWCTSQAIAMTDGACLYNAGSAYLVTNYTLADIGNPGVYAATCS